MTDTLRPRVKTPDDLSVTGPRRPRPDGVPAPGGVAANGVLTGFSARGGVATKRRILQLERAPGFGRLDLFG